MRTLRIHKTDNGPVAKLQELSVDELSAGDVLIKVRYSSINYKDALAVTGKGRIVRKPPLNGGIDAAGIVESSEDARFAAGDEVLVTGYFLSETRDGGYAEYLRVPADCVVALPAGLSLFEAMGLGTAGFTAGFAKRRLLENGQTPDLGPIAVTGATGGVGSFALNILSSAGFEVIALTRKAERAGDYLRTLGASQVLAPDEYAGAEKPLEAARLGGAVDSVGGALLSSLLTQVVPYGNIAAIGLAGGFKLEMTVMPFILRGVSLLGIHSVECPMSWRQEIWQDLAGASKPPHLDKIIQRTIGLADVAQACESMIAGEIEGRTVVDLEK